MRSVNKAKRRGKLDPLATEKLTVLLCHKYKMPNFILLPANYASTHGAVEEKSVKTHHL